MINKEHITHNPYFLSKENSFLILRGLEKTIPKDFYPSSENNYSIDYQYRNFNIKLRMDTLLDGKHPNFDKIVFDQTTIIGTGWNNGHHRFYVQESDLPADEVMMMLILYFA